MLEEVKQDQRYIDFLIYFNLKRDYFHCHDLLEEIWLEDKEKFGVLKYLIQVSIMQYKKLIQKNEVGFLKLYENSSTRYERFKQDLEKIGIDSQSLKDNLQKVGQSICFYQFDLIITDTQLRKKVYW